MTPQEKEAKVAAAVAAMKKSKYEDAFYTIAGAIGGFLLVPVIFMFTWNFVAPLYWLGAPDLNYFQALGTHVLLNIIGYSFKPVAKVK